MDLLIKNARVITASEDHIADILIKGEKISEIAPRLESSEAVIIDAEGKLVFPGLIDVHTHFQLITASGYMSADDFTSGTRSAACGGVTAFIDFAHQERGKSLKGALETRIKEAKGRALIDYSFHLAPLDLTSQTQNEIAELVRGGFPSLKVYRTYRHLKLTDEDFYNLLGLAGKINALVGIHAEDDAAVEKLIAAFGAEGKLAPQYHALSRPDQVEAGAIAQAIEWAGENSAPLYIFHASTALGLKEIEKAREAGGRVFAETTPNYLLLTAEKYQQLDACLYVLTPPLRSENDRQSLWEGLKTNGLQVVATDHCSYEL